MRFDFYGLAFETPRVTFYLWSPWRAAALEHRLFEAVRGLPRAEVEELPDELRVHLGDPKACRAALQAVARVLKGWQEEADPHSERRTSKVLIPLVPSANDNASACAASCRALPASLINRWLPHFEFAVLMPN